MKEIKLFLAHTSEVKEDIEKIKLIIHSKYQKNKKIDIIIEHWSDADKSLSQDRFQQRLNKVIGSCDILYIFFQNRIGEYTKEEFYYGLKRFEEYKKPYSMSIFFKNFKLDDNASDEEWDIATESRKFKKEIKKLNGNQYTFSYKNIDDLRDRLLSQLEIDIEKLINSDSTKYSTINKYKVNKILTCIHTKETKIDKSVIISESTLVNKKSNILPNHDLIYEDWRYYTTPNTLNEEIIDKADIIIAMVHNIIENKLKDEIDRVLNLKKVKRKDLKFLLCFKSFQVNSNKKDECNKLRSILDYREYLNKENDNMDILYYDNEDDLWEKIQSYLVNWLEEEASFLGKKIYEKMRSTNIEIDDILNNIGDNQ